MLLLLLAWCATWCAVTFHVLRREHMCLIVATDGVWEVGAAGAGHCCCAPVRAWSRALLLFTCADVRGAAAAHLCGRGRATDGLWGLEACVAPPKPLPAASLCPTPAAPRFLSTRLRQVLSPSEAVKLVCDVMAEGRSAESAAAELCREAVQLASSVRQAGLADNTTATVFVFAEL